MSFCPKCGNRVSETDLFCPNCGFAIQERAGANTGNTVHESSLRNGPSTSTQYVQPKKKKHPVLTIIIVLLVLGAIGSRGAKSKTTETQSTKATSAPVRAAETAAQPSPSTAVPAAATPAASITPTPTTDWLKVYAENNTDVLIVQAEVLYQYGAAYVGSTVLTYIDVASVSGNSLKANTENNDTFSYSIVASFEDKNEIKGTNNGDKVFVIGTVDEFSSISILGAGTTVNLSNCHIVTSGISASSINSNREAQIQYAEMRLEQLAREQANALEAEKQAYMQGCVTVSYSDVERNPNQYKGTTIKVSGKVVQVQEGWFDSVTMRVDQGGGNYWYVTYKRADENESRILENDYVTFYGECDGVTSYTSVLGSKVTIPALSAKYYN